MRAAIALIALLVSAAVAQSIDPVTLASLQNTEKALAELNYDALTPEEQRAYDIFAAYVKGRYESLNNPEPKQTRRASIPGIYPGVYNRVDLMNANDFKVRQVTAITLRDVVTNLLSSLCGPLAPVCKLAVDGLVNDILPDVTFIQSLNLAATINATLVGSADLDLLMHLVAFPPKDTIIQKTIGDYFNFKLLPSAAVAYFDANAKFKGNFLATAIDFDASAFAVSQTFISLIEFVDNNNNGEYDAGEEVGEMKFHEHSWETQPLEKVEDGTQVVYEMLSSTKDSVMNLYCTTASLPVIAGDGQVITPHSLKCSVVIVNYPFKTQNSRLAMKTFVALAEGNFGGEATTNQGVSLNVQQSGSKKGYVNWVDTVTTSETANSKTFNVVASGTAKKTSGVVDFIGELAIVAGGSGSADAREIIYTFQTGPNPQLVIWDPTVGYGQQAIVPPPVNPDDSAASSLTPLVALVAAAILAVATLL